MRMTALLLKSTHPGPTVIVTTIALALGISAGVEAGRLVLLTASVLLGQISIGLSNDAIDAPRDRVSGRRDKPLAQPGAPLRAALMTAAVTAALALVLSAMLGWQLALAHAVFLASGWAYNAALKSTVWSAACFLVGFGVFPSLAPLALPEPQVAPAWAWLAGAALGVAVHFSNVLPDLEDDERTGVRGLPHRMGRRGSAVVAFGALLAGAAAALAGPMLMDRTVLDPTVLDPTVLDRTAVGPAAWIAGVAVAALAVWGLAASVSRTPTRLSFRLVMLAALLLALQLVVSGWRAA